MKPDSGRLERLCQLMLRARLDALVCQLPHNVLMLSGYLPVLCQSIVVLLPDGDGTIIAPEAELPFARDGWFPDIRTFSPVTLDYILSPSEVAVPHLAQVLCEKGVSDGIIGIEQKPTTIAVPYLEVHIPNMVAVNKWAAAMPSAIMRDATVLLEEAAMVKTEREIERITIACALAEFGYQAARTAIRAGAREVEVAVEAKSAIERTGTGFAGVRRVSAWAFCVSGPRSADAHLPYQHSTNRRLEPGDSAVVHINCHADGFWTDMTRTFFVGEADNDRRDVYEAVLKAWEHSVRASTIGRPAREVDAAGRDILTSQGYADTFLHGIGHGVGFRALYHGERPVIHPRSDDVIERDMVFNIEPAAYFADQWGMRICDLVAIRTDRAQVLSSIRRDIDWAICPAEESRYEGDRAA